MTRLRTLHEDTVFSTREIPPRARVPPEVQYKAVQCNNFTPYGGGLCGFLNDSPLIECHMTSHLGTLQSGMNDLPRFYRKILPIKSILGLPIIMAELMLAPNLTSNGEDARSAVPLIHRTSPSPLRTPLAGADALCGVCDCIILQANNTEQVLVVAQIQEVPAIPRLYLQSFPIIISKAEVSFSSRHLAYRYKQSHRHHHEERS